MAFVIIWHNVSMWISITIVVIVAAIIAIYLTKPRAKGSRVHGGYDFFIHTINHRRTRKKETRLAEIVDYAKRNGSITNNQVEDLLSVSDATASRYLGELEAQGRLQRHADGRSTHYTP